VHQLVRHVFGHGERLELRVAGVVGVNHQEL
jgi:hypothetical protein